MKKENDFKSQLVNFNCVSCGKTIQLISTINSENFSIDVCSNCHPFYLNKTGAQQSKGRAEKFMNKFNVGKSLAKAKNNK
ncbi:MAG: 50S ribosomal protein L31 [Mycoplasmoidaceae bacterium]